MAGSVFGTRDAVGNVVVDDAADQAEIVKPGDNPWTLLNSFTNQNPSFEVAVADTEEHGVADEATTVEDVVEAIAVSPSESNSGTSPHNQNNMASRSRSEGRQFQACCCGCFGWCWVVVGNTAALPGESKSGTYQHNYYMMTPSFQVSRQTVTSVL